MKEECTEAGIEGKINRKPGEKDIFEKLRGTLEG